jgi:hypothetical protein
MAHMAMDGVPSQQPEADAPTGERPESESARRGQRPRTPPRVWPPLSSSELGRGVRRLGAVLTAPGAAG